MFFKKDDRHKKFIETYKNFKGYEKAWIDNKKLWLEPVSVIPPLFPILVIEKLNNKLYVDKVECFNDIFEPDYIGYEWEQEEFIIDSRGNKYIVDCLDMYHPIGFVYPSKIIKQFSLSEIKDLLRGAHKLKLTDELLACKSIEELINKLKI